MPDPLRAARDKVDARPRQSYDRKTVDRDVYSLALERADEILTRFDTIAVAFSGGKDSTATLNVMLEAAHRGNHHRHLPMRACFYDEEAIPYQTEHYVRRVGERDDVALEWYCAPLESSNACSRMSPKWYPWAPEDEHLWVRPKPPEAIELPGFPITPIKARLPHYASNGLLFDHRRDGLSALCMGIRAQESLTRLRAVTRRKLDNYLVPYTGSEAGGRGGGVRDDMLLGHGITKAYPVYDWTLDDVWAAPKILGWDYNEAYDVMEMAGVAPHNQRCSPAFGNEPLQKLWTYHVCFPEIWAKMVERVPGVGAAARYALTELYAYRGRPVKPDDITWPDMIRAYIDKHEPEARERTARQIHSWLRHHYSYTTDPLVVEAPHPLTGVSWDWLLMLAMRGDPKDRKQPGGRIKRHSSGAKAAASAAPDHHPV